MKVYKDRQYLVFELDDGGTVKYDFANRIAIGKSGRKVNNLNKYFPNVSIDKVFDSCEDKRYARYLEYVKRRTRRDLSNIGSLIEETRRYSNIEQIFSAGITNVHNLLDTRTTMKDIPKGLLKILIDKDVVLTNELIELYKAVPDYTSTILNEQYTTLTETTVVNYVCFSTRGPTSWLLYMMNNYGYNPVKLMRYIDDLATYEAIGAATLKSEITDYAYMMAAISKNGKFDKFPKHFLTTHRIASRNYERMKKEFDAEVFERRRDESLEAMFGDYVFLYPKTTDDIKKEAAAMNNCVVSYIDKVLAGECHILFLRKKDAPDESLVTIEARLEDGAYKIVQARRKYNYAISAEEHEAVEKWNSLMKKRAA